jgi:phosphoribosyl 1,2-cyclic phosphodiesterase
VQCGNRSIVLDAGTGIRGFGQWLMRQPQRELHLLLSHVHWDHINGFPFFDPVYHNDFKIQVWAGSLRSQNQSIQAVISQQMQAPTFPISLDALSATVTFSDFEAGDRFTLDGDIEVATAALAHPNQATAYRIEHGGSSVCYVTDTEHRQGQPDAAILNLIRGSDLVIYDSTYTDSEYTIRYGWGHSTWQEGVRLAKAAGAKQLAIFHHDPDHDDQFMDRVANEAKAMWPGAFVASEGTVIALNE